MRKFLKTFSKKTRSAFAVVYSRAFLRDMKDPTLEFLAGAAFLLLGPALIPLVALYVTISETRRNGKA